jgi:small subunit ribosomal protein S20
MRTSAKRRERNRQVRSRVRSAVRRFTEAAPQEKPVELQRLTSELDNAVRKGVLKENTASRMKSRFAKALNRETQAAH